jgi:cytochrome P450
VQTLAVDGAAPRRELAVRMPPFHGACLQAYGRLIQEVTLRRIEAWRAGQTFRMQAFAQALALEAMLTIIFGPRDQEQIEARARTIPAYFQAFTTLLVYFPPLRRPFGSGWPRPPITPVPRTLTIGPMDAGIIHQDVPPRARQSSAARPGQRPRAG